MLAHKHVVLRQVTKPLNGRVLFEETEMPEPSAFGNENFQCLFHICACEYLTFVLKSFVIHFEVFCRSF